jgi:hypothetical protein
MKLRCLIAGALVLLLMVVVMPVAAEGQSGTTLSATVDVTPHWTTTYHWTIDKSVTPDTWDMWCGDTGTSTYTIIVTKDSGTEEAWVDGQVCVTNGGASATEDLAITAELQDGYGPPNDFLTSAAVDVSGHPVLAPGETHCYEYHVDIPVTGGAFPQPHAGGTYKVTADVTITNHSGHLGTPFGPSPSATTVFPSAPSSVDDQINVDDTNGGSWTFNTGGSVNYDETFMCCADNGTHENTATIRETGQNDTASVEVVCNDLEIGDQLTKDAITSFDRTYSWSIDKSADQSALTLSMGQQFLVNYAVKVNNTGYIDSNWAVSGTVTVKNDVAGIPLVINSISDVISPDIPVTVDFGVSFPYTIDVDESLTGTYSANLPDATDRTNTVTVTIQNYDYDQDGNPTPSGTTDFTRTVDVKFNDATITEKDKCIDVTDTYTGSLGTVCIGDAPKTFTYSHSIGPYGTCGDYTVVNTASFTTKDTGATGSDDWTVHVKVPCLGGCTLTPGYWKTHSSYGPAPYDHTWALLPGGADTPFFKSGQTWYRVLWTPPAGGNVYYQLSFQYIAARLNVLNGAATTPAVDSALSSAESFFATYAPGDAAKFKPTSTNRVNALGWATTLSQYNIGFIGPGHCSE